MGTLLDQYSKEELAQIIANSFSISEVLTKIGYSTTSGENYKTLEKRINYFKIPINHFTHRYKKEDIQNEEVFCENSKVSQSTLRRRFKKENFKEYKCEECGLEPYWNGEPLTLTLDHINGNNKDNRIENLRWICPNCDRQSSTFGTRNKKKLSKGVELRSGNYKNPIITEGKVTKHLNDTKVVAKYCINCGREVKGTSVYCLKCSRIFARKVERPTKEELFGLLVKQCGYFEKVGDMFGVNGNTIRKWCKYYNLPFHSYDYREKKTKNRNKIIKRAVNQIDIKTNEVIATFESIWSAEKNTGIQHIGDVANGKRKTAGGYKWGFS